MNKSTILIITVLSIAVLGMGFGYYWMNVKNQDNRAENFQEKIDIPAENNSPEAGSLAPDSEFVELENGMPVSNEPVSISDNGQILNTPEGAANAPQVTEREPQLAAQTYSYITTCNQACAAVGYSAGYCGNWIENSDNTISECAGQKEFALYEGYYDGMKLNDCRDTGAADAKKKTICCCKGEPQNPSDCPAIQWPSEPTDCVEQPGYLKNPKTGACCWYKATCYGPRDKGWSEYYTKKECLAGK